MAQSRRKQQDRLITIPTVASVVDHTEHDIAVRAYALYEQRGGEHGHDLDDWLQAERELRSVLRSTAA
jgi:hypothetical protein